MLLLCWIRIFNLTKIVAQAQHPPPPLPSHGYIKPSLQNRVLRSHSAFLSIWWNLAASFCHVIGANAAFQHIKIHQYSFNLQILGYWQHRTTLISPLCLILLMKSSPVCLPLHNYRKAGEKVINKDQKDVNEGAKMVRG